MSQITSNVIIHYYYLYVKVKYEYPMYYSFMNQPSSPILQRRSVFPPSHSPQFLPTLHSTFINEQCRFGLLGHGWKPNLLQGVEGGSIEPVEAGHHSGGVSTQLLVMAKLRHFLPVCLDKLADRQRPASFFTHRET